MARRTFSCNIDAREINDDRKQLFLRTWPRMVGSLERICPRAFRAFVRMNTGGASKDCRMTFKIGLK